MFKNILTNNDCYKANRTITPKGVMVHSTGCNQPKLSVWASSWNKSGVEACVHAFIGKNSAGNVEVMQTLPWTHRGWHAGTGTSGKSANNTHISFEICEDDLTDPEYFKECYKEAVKLCASLCQQFRLNPYTDVICHSEGYQQGVASNHADVMHWFPKHGKTMDMFRKDVKALMDDATKYEPGKWSEEARKWASENGFIAGYGNGDYGWGDHVTREQLAVILYRIFNKEN